MKHHSTVFPMQLMLKNYWFLFLKTLLFVFVVVLLLSSCSGGNTDSGSGALPSGNYNSLYAYNAYRLDGHTIRWASETIPVYGATGAGWQEAINRWPTVRFQFVSSKPSAGIKILGYDDLGNACGLSSFAYDSAGRMESCTITISNKHEPLGCGKESDTVAHEIGHCIGIFKHTSDGGLMDKKAEDSTEITSTVKDMISLLYALSPGTDINTKVAARRPGKTRGKSRYQPVGGTRYSGGLASVAQH